MIREGFMVCYEKGVNQTWDLNKSFGQSLVDFCIRLDIYTIEKMERGRTSLD